MKLQSKFPKFLYDGIVRKNSDFFLQKEAVFLLSMSNFVSKT